MAMTKKERAEFDAAILRAETLAALRWTAPVEKDVPPPKDGGYSEGWTFNSHSLRVEIGWSTSVSHGSGPAPKDGRYTSRSQRGVWMYSTKAKALAAMRHDLERRYAETLRQIDRQMLEAGDEA